MNQHAKVLEDLIYVCYISLKHTISLIYQIILTRVIRFCLSTHTILDFIKDYVKKLPSL